MGDRIPRMETREVMKGTLKVCSRSKKRGLSWRTSSTARKTWIDKRINKLGARKISK